MLAQRIARQSLRQVVASQPGFALSARAPSIIANAILTPQRRLAATQSMTAEQASTQILAKQRLNRPVAPHLAIYKAQVTWYLSALNRVTGVILSGTFYAFGLAYLAAPALGWHLETASLVAAFASFPVWAKFGTKLFFSLPFTFHSFNGLRHLTWDTGRAFTNRQVQVTGWSVVGLTFVTSLLLAVV